MILPFIKFIVTVFAALAILILGAAACSFIGGNDSDEDFKENLKKLIKDLKK